MDILEVEKRDKLVKERLLRCDDRGDLRVYSYVNYCKTWNDITLNSRGIILNRRTGETIAAPFPKFFNMNQTESTQEKDLPWNDGFRIFKKYDGWFGILYRDDGYRIATRGSFKSTGAIWATEFLKRYNLEELPDDTTLLYELICPATKIVVNYGDTEDLILLAAYNRHTGDEYSWEQVEVWSKQFGFTLARSYTQDQLGHCRWQLQTTPGDELEGYVIRFNNGLRVKIKSADYFRRSALLAGLTPLKIWVTMKDGCVPQQIWDDVSKDYRDLLSRIASTLEKGYGKLRSQILEDFDRLNVIKWKRDSATRSTFAKIVRGMDHEPVMFALFDSSYNRVDDYIMKKIRPHGNTI
jgi:RNA ligase